MRQFRELSSSRARKKGADVLRDHRKLDWRKRSRKKQMSGVSSRRRRPQKQDMKRGPRDEVGEVISDCPS